jgi:indolepyruvate ferredoxin oxidoreductase
MPDQQPAYAGTAPTLLSGRYTNTAGRVQLTGIQALARLPIDQHRRDLAAGRTVATFISGYEGSPLAGYDLELARQRDLLEVNDVTVVPALNEEAAATAIQGTQLANTFDDATRDGVLGIWYGKAPGLDRATDAMRHGNLMGSHPDGGALALVGDDPAAKSSSVPCSSEFALADVAMPFLYPGDSEDVLELGLHAIELSRASGLWVGLKIVTAVADGSSTVDLDAIARLDGDVPLPHGAKKHVPTARLLQPTLGPLERDLVTNRLRIAREYAALNNLNRIIGSGKDDRIGIVAAGRTWHDLLTGLRTVGLDPDEITGSPVRLLKVGMPWPLEPEIIKNFASGLDEILVLEEKRSFMESAVRDILYGRAHAPHVTGKTDIDGRELVPAYAELDVDILAPRLYRRLAAHGVPAADPDRDPARAAGRTTMPLAPASDTRTPYFCSGCPHNSSTKSSGGSLVGAGIGCHAMVLMMDESQVGSVTGLSQMGGEGLQWVGMSPFVERGHFVQNLGDGTFDHSGSLAIRAAVASGVNITYKLLYNSAVAMTGGQRAVGGMGVEQIVGVLLAEGVSRVIVTTEDTKRYRRRRLPTGVKVWHRDRLDDAVQQLAATPGVTVLVHDQECAAEKRRKRKRGLLDEPPTRVFINERICEGCGDCGRKSNCLSVQPVTSDLGRKTQIHQPSCNVDYSCLQGDCPAFMTVLPAKHEQRDARLSSLSAADVPTPHPIKATDSFGVRLTGVGGSGVVTVSQVLAMAGLIAGWTARSLDQTGLAQKGGAVVSDVRFDRTGRGSSNKLAAGGCDLYIGCDVLVAAEPGNLTVTSAERTVAVIDTTVVPTGRMVADPSLAFPSVDGLVDSILGRAGPGSELLDARRLVHGLFGDDQFTNLFLVGIGLQKARLPLPATAVEEAIRLNGVAVEQNLQAFRRGRQYALDPAAVTAAATTESDATAGGDRWAAMPGENELDRLVRSRSNDLVEYQDERYAQRYRDAVLAIRAAEARVRPGSTDLAESVARHLYKLMAYKDEYEVARLALDPGVDRELTARFGVGAKAWWNLHPPAIRALGLKQKLRLGRWFRPALEMLHRARGLRGTALDPFGRARVRVVERELVVEYLDLLDHVVQHLSRDNHEIAVALAGLPDMVRGYEQVKLDNVNRYREAQTRLRGQFDAAGDADPCRLTEG